MKKRIYHVEPLPEMNSTKIDKYMNELVKILKKNNPYISELDIMKNFSIEHIDTWTN